MSVVASPVAGDLVLLRQNAQAGRQGDDAPLPPRTADRSGDPVPSDNFKLSLNSLQLGESFDTVCRQHQLRSCCLFWEGSLLYEKIAYIEMQIKLDVGLLAWHIGRFPAEVGNSGTKVSEDELCAMLELSQNIGNNIDKIFALRNQNNDDASCHSLSTDEEASVHSHRSQKTHTTHKEHETHGSKRRRDSVAYSGTTHNRTRGPKRRKMMICRTCLTENTPKWRNGPAGPSTLCNVCGLVYEKRRDRIQAKAERKSKSIC